MFPTPSRPKNSKKEAKMKYASRIIGAILVLAIIAGGIFGVEYVLNKFEKDKVPVYNPSEIKEVVISLDEWIGWKPLIYANGGLSTTADSINARNGINVKYVVMNDATVSSAGLISGELQGAGYTVNRYAFLQSKFDDAKVDVVMPYITNYSNGGDGIISKSEIRSVKDLVGKKIAVPKFSEAQTLVEWLLKNSDLSDAEVAQIHADMAYFETADDTAEAFFAGSVDAAATWEPYLTQASSSTNSRILFDTSMGTNLILDGLVFRKDFLDVNEEFIVKLIDGALEANAMYLREFNSIKVMPMFELMDNDEIKDMCANASVATWADNMNLLSSSAVIMYKQMANIWISLGEKAVPEKSETAFTTAYIEKLKDKYPDDEVTSFAFSNEGRQAAQQIDNNSALLSVKLNVKFEVDSYKISSESYPDLIEFADTAKMLNGVYIQIEGNTAKVDGDDGKDFSYKRARSVAKYLQGLGINPSRFIIIGNGDSNPIASNNTEEGKAANRRTEVFFKVVGY